MKNIICLLSFDHALREAYFKAVDCEAFALFQLRILIYIISFPSEEVLWKLFELTCVNCEAFIFSLSNIYRWIVTNEAFEYLLLFSNFTYIVKVL